MNGTKHLKHLIGLALLTWMLAAAPLLGETDVRRDAAVTATEEVMPSVVNIATETVREYHDWYDELLRHFYGAPQAQKSMSLGSGVIIDEDGYILTNFHVIRRATRIQVKLWDGREYEAEQLVATEYSDVALLKLKAKPGEKFKAIKFAADDDLLLAETVLALGNPYGLGAAVTKGILSSKNRRPPTDKEPLNVEDWLQTDAAINPGNSGGPLVNLRGELIGLNVAVYRDPEQGERGPGIGFSIPVKQVSAAISRFFTPEVTDSLWFGARFKGGPGPLLVAAVQPDTPAARAGLKEGDRVLEVNKQPVRTIIACNRALCSAADHKPALLVQRGNERTSVKVHLVPLEELIRERLGLTLLEVTAQTAERLGLRNGQGLFIEEVEKNSPAARAQLQRGFLLAGIDGRAASNLQTVAEILNGHKKGDTVTVTVIVPRRLGSSFVEFRQGTAELTLR